MSWVERAKGRWLCALMIVMLLLGLTFALSDVVYETNDDNAIASALSGGVTGEPHAGNCYTSYLYGAIVAGLYKVCPSLPWHALALLLLQAVALVAVLYALLLGTVRRRLPLAAAPMAFVGLYVGVAVKFVVRLQYTAAPGFLGAAAIALWWGASLEKGRRAANMDRVLALLLVAAAFLLRYKSGLLLLPLLFLNCIGKAWTTHSWKPLSSIVALLVLAGVLFGLDAVLYRVNESGWDAQVAYDKARTELIDYHSAEEIVTHAPEATNWSETLAERFANWYFLDERITTGAMTAVTEHIRQEASSAEPLGVLRAVGSILYRYSMFDWNAAAFLLLLLISFVICIKRRRWLDSLLLATTTAYLLAVIAYFYGILHRFPDRLAFAAACPVYVMLLLWMTYAMPARSQPRRMLAYTAAAGGRGDVRERSVRRAGAPRNAQRTCSTR